MGALKIASLMPTFYEVKEKLARAVIESQASREGHQKAYEELLLVQADRVAKETELSTCQTKLSELKKKHNTLADTLKETKEDLDAKNAKLQATEGWEEKVKAAEDKANKYKSAKNESETSRMELAGQVMKLQLSLEASVQGSYDNCWRQVQYLNLGVKFNTSGMHYKSYFLKGVLVPYVETPEGDEDSTAETLLEEEEEEDDEETTA